MHELHWESYKKDNREFQRRIDLLMSSREESIYVDFDPGSGRFWTPEERFKLAGDLRETAKLDFECALLLFQMLILGWMPSKDTILKVFQLQRGQAQKAALR